MFGCHIFGLAPISNNAPHWIHSNPELAFEEHQACNNIVSLLKNRGFTVISPAYDLATSFESTYSFFSSHEIFMHLSKKPGHYLPADHTT